MTFLKLGLLAIIVFFIAITIVVVSQEVGAWAGFILFGALAFGAYSLMKVQFRRM